MTQPVVEVDELVGALGSAASLLIFSLNSFFEASAAAAAAVAAAFASGVTPGAAADASSILLVPVEGAPVVDAD